MSKFANIPVKIPETVQVQVADGKVVVTGPKGTLSRSFPKILDIKIEKPTLMVTLNEKVPTKFGLSIQGTIRSHIVNMVNGVTTGWSKKLEVIGTGYRAEVRGNILVLTVGFSHPIEITAPEGVKFSIEKNVITVDGVDREVVGQVAAQIKAVRRPDPYKGKGIRYFGEILKLKPGKQAAKTTA